MTASHDRTRRVTLPEHLVEQVEERLAVTDFDSVDEYVAFVLEETLVRVESDGSSAPDTDNSDAVQSRLESLGYLDS